MAGNDGLCGACGAWRVAQLVRPPVASVASKRQRVCLPPASGSRRREAVRPAGEPNKSHAADGSRTSLLLLSIQILYIYIYREREIILFPNLWAASERRPERAPTVADGAGPDSRLVNARPTAGHGPRPSPSLHLHVVGFLNLAARTTASAVRSLASHTSPDSWCRAPARPDVHGPWRRTRVSEGQSDSRTAR